MFVAIPDSTLVLVAAILKAEGFILQPGCDVRSNIVRIAERDYPRTDGNHWRFPKGYTLKAVFYPAFEAAPSAVVTPKGKGKGKGKSVQAVPAPSGKRVKGSPEAIAWGKEMAARRAAKSGKAAPAPAPAQASGTLTQAQIEAIAQATAVAVAQALAAI
jgi:hypothetical protein